MEQVVVGTEKFPEHDTYTGPAERAEIVFRNVKGLSLVYNWLMDDIIKLKCKFADVTPLRATLKKETIKESWLDYVTDQYTLIFYYHDSPSVASVILAISVALTAAGFLVLTLRSEPQVWTNLSTAPKAVAETAGAVATTTKETSKAVSSIAVSGAVIGALVVFSRMQKKRI